MNTLGVRILIIGGVLNFGLSFGLGWLLSVKRMREPIAKHHWLLTAHTVSLQEGLLLIAIAYALSMTRAPAVLVGWAAWFLVSASAFQDFSGIINWWRSTGDQFAERSTGWIFATVNAVLNSAGLAITIYAVIAT
jgi:hypothetical protein